MFWTTWYTNQTWQTSHSTTAECEQPFISGAHQAFPGETLMLDWKLSLDTFKRTEIIQISYQIGIRNKNTEITFTLPDFKAYNGATVIKTVLVLARGQIYTLMKQILKSRQTLTSKGKWFSTRAPRQFDRKRTVFSTNSEGTTEYQHTKNSWTSSLYH